MPECLGLASPMLPWGQLRVHGPDGGGGTLTRALGLPALAAVISPVPDTADIPIGPDDRFLVLSRDAPDNASVLVLDLRGGMSP